MKILFVQKMNGLSGSELYLLQIMPELKRRGHEPELFMFFNRPTDKNKRIVSFLTECGIKVYEVYNHNTFSPILIYKFFRLLKKEKYDLVHSNLVHADFLVGGTKFFLKRKLRVLSVKHGYHPAYQAKYGADFRYIKRNLFYWIERFSSGIANYNVTISKGLYNVFTEGGIVKPSKIRNIYYGLTLKEPVEKTATVTIPEGDYALIIGRLVGFKGHKYLIEAWQKVQAKLPSFRLYIAGEGGCHAELEELVASYGLQESVLFLGHVPNPHPLIENCAFTLITSTWEGFGLILLESWLHKKAIVAFDVPALNEVIDDRENGFLVPFKNTDELAEKIIWMHQHPETAAAMGEKGYEKLSSYYTLKRMTDETEEVFELIKNNKV